MTSKRQIISSATNSVVKRLRGLERKKIRMETGCFLAEGARLAEQALLRGWHVETLITGPDEQPAAHIQALIDHVIEKGGQHIQVTARLLGSISRKHNPQAVLSEIRQKPLQLDLLQPDPAGLWMGLYEIRDPGNLGTILRTLDCAGAAGIILIGNCCDPYSPEAVRASMGSVFDVALARTDFTRFDQWRRENGLKLIGASMKGPHSHTETDFITPGLILMGNEQSGLPDEVETACDHLCRIPMRGGADSLNLAQASAVLLYGAWRQRGFA